MVHTKEEIDRPIVFFDGYCGLCNRSVNFLMKRDKKNALYFAPLQGQTAEALFHHGELELYDSIVLYYNERVYYRSTAILKLLLLIGRGWQLMGIFFIIPSFIRNALYEFIAKNRLKWFGKRETCRMPTPEERDKILP